MSRETFAKARARLLAELAEAGWIVIGHLKVPHATSPDGLMRLWFKAQAVYGSTGARHVLGDARSVESDMRPRASSRTWARGWWTTWWKGRKPRCS